MDDRKLVTVLTTDMRNFTSQSSRHEHRDLSEAIFSEHFNLVCDIVTEFHNLTLSVIKDFDSAREAIVLSTGDGMIVGFTNEDHALSAVRSAVALQDRYVNFFTEANQRLRERREASKLNFGIGIHSGFVVVKQFNSYRGFGELQRLILGDAVNISVRLESLSKEHPEARIIVSDETIKLIDPAVLNTDLVDIHIIRGYGSLKLYGIPGRKAPGPSGER